MHLRFSDALWYWRGPAPWHFVSVPPDAAELIADLAPAVSYGWGMIPATVRIGSSEWTTSLWPKDGGYLVPIKSWVRAAEGLEIDDIVEVELRIG
ncbi:DUF1905 domain-containing protein [Agromyces soli]